MKLVAMTLLVLVCFVSGANGQSRSNDFDQRFGIGLMIGDPISLSAKIWHTEEQALVFGMAWRKGGFNPNRDIIPAGDTRFLVQADYMFHNFEVFDSDGLLPIEYGFGARYTTGGFVQDAFSIRAVGGASYLLPGVPMDIFIQAAPFLQVTPETSFGFSAGIGARYYPF